MVPNNFIPVDETNVEHPEVGIKSNVTSPSVCDVCGKTYSSRSLLYKHQLTHETMNIPCEQCQKICDTKTKLRDHVKRVHGDRVSCNTCQKSFSSKNNLRIHELNAHEDQASICQICFNSVSKTNLKVHEKSCQKKFVKQINDHYVSMGAKNKIKYNCSKCDKKYGNKEKYEHHESTCTGKKPVLVKCDLCDKELKSSLERHIRSNHKIVMGENYLLVKDKSKPKIVKKNTCHHCHKDFTRKYDLKIHTKKYHFQ